MVGFILYGCVSSAQGYIGRAIVARSALCSQIVYFFPPPYLHPPGSTFYLSFSFSLLLSNAGPRERKRYVSRTLCTMNKSNNW